MRTTSILRIALVAGAAASLSACGYGYGGGGIGYASDYPAGYGYGDIGYAGGGYYGGVGYPGYGYYNDFYYPGTGIYVFDRGGNRRRWTNDERNHWQQRGGVRPNGGVGGYAGGQGRVGQDRGRQGRADAQPRGYVGTRQRPGYVADGVAGRAGQGQQRQAVVPQGSVARAAPQDGGQRPGGAGDARGGRHGGQRGNRSN